MDRNELGKQRVAFAAFLRETRENHGISLSQVAESLGVKEETIEQWELGRRRMDIVELCAYCRAVGLSLDRCAVFMGVTKDEPNDN